MEWRFEDGHNCRCGIGLAGKKDNRAAQRLSKDFCNVNGNENHLQVRRVQRPHTASACRARIAGIDVGCQTRKAQGATHSRRSIRGSPIASRSRRPHNRGRRCAYMWGRPCIGRAGKTRTTGDCRRLPGTAAELAGDGQLPSFARAPLSGFGAPASIGQLRRHAVTFSAFTFDTMPVFAS